MGSTAIRVAQFGKQTVWATGVAATAKFMGAVDMSIKPDVTRTTRRYLDGTFNPASVTTITDRKGMFKMSGDFTFEDWLMVATSSVGDITPTGTTAKTWAVPFPLATAPTLTGRTIEYSDGQQAYRLIGGLVSDWTLSGAATADGLVQFDSNWIGYDVEKMGGGLTGALSNRAVETLPTGAISLYIDAFGGTVGTTVKASTLISWSLSYNPSIHLKKFQGGNIRPSSFGFGVPTMTLQCTAEFNSVGVAQVDEYLSGPGQLIRLEGSGSLITGATYKRLRLDLAGDITQIGDLHGDRDGNTTVDFTMTCRYDTGAFAHYAKGEVVNAVATLPG